MTTTNDQPTRMTVHPTKINDPALIAADQHREIAPTPRCAARTSLVITTETEHNYTMTRKDTKYK
jgi:hypothetical protein